MKLLSPTLLMILAAFVVTTAAHAEPNLDANAEVEHVAITGTAYYVDYEGGDDSNDGQSPDTPWKHSPNDSNADGVARNTKLQPGDGLIFKGGVIYRGTVGPGNSGEPNAPIILDGNTAGTFGEGRAIIDASEVLEGWQRTTAPGIEHDVYVTDLPEDAGIFSVNLYAGSQRMSIAQAPTPSDFYDTTNLDEYFDLDPVHVTLGSIQDPDRLDSLFGDGESGHAYILLWANDNRVARQPVKDYDANTGTVTFEEVRRIYDSRTNRYAVVNAFGAMDSPGEYVVDMDNGKIYMIPFDDFDPDAPNVTHSVRRLGVEVRQDYVVVQGFIVQKAVGVEREYHRGVGISVRGSRPESRRHGVVVQDNEVRFNNSYLRYGAIYTQHTDGLKILHNHVHRNVANRSIMVTHGVGTVMNHNLVERGGHTGLSFFHTTEGIMAHNTIRDVTAVHANGISIYLDSHDNLIFGNDVRDGNIALTIKHSQNVTVAFNVLQTSRDVFTVADWGDGAGNLTYRNNIMLNDYGRALLVNDSSRENLVIQNNIIDGNLAADAVERDDVTISHNIYTSRSWRQKSKSDWVLEEGEHLIEDRARLFRDPDNGDFRPAEGVALRPAAAIEFEHDIEGKRISEPMIGPYVPEE